MKLATVELKSEAYGGGQRVTAKFMSPSGVVFVGVGYDSFCGVEAATANALEDLSKKLRATLPKDTKKKV